MLLMWVMVIVYDKQILRYVRWHYSIVCTLNERAESDFFRKKSAVCDLDVCITVVPCVWGNRNIARRCVVRVIVRNVILAARSATPIIYLFRAVISVHIQNGVWLAVFIRHKRTVFKTSTKNAIRISIGLYGFRNWLIMLLLYL